MIVPRVGIRPFRFAIWLIPPLVLVAFWLPGINEGGFRVDTGLYSAIALHAYRTGDLIHLHAGDQPYFNKPPLAFWIHGLFLWLLGPQLWVARLPSLLAAILTTLATMRATRILSGPRTAFAAGLVLVSTIEFFRYTRAFSLDLWLAFFLAASLIFAAWSVREDRARFLVMAGVPIGLSLLIKPVLGLLTLLVLAAWLAWMGRARRAVWLLPAAVVALAIAAPWHLAMTARYGGAFWSHYLLKESVERATGSAFDAEPWWFFPKLLGETYWPWLIVLVAALAALIRRGRILPRRPGAERLALVGTGVWLVALSAFAGKQTRYLVHVYPYMAMLCGAYLTCPPGPRVSPRLRRTGRRLRWLFGPSLIVAGVVMLIGGVRVHGPPDPQWGDLYAYLDTIDVDRLWVDPASTMRWTSCNVYLHSGRWPRTAHVRPDIAETIGAPANPPETASPRVGDLMLFRGRSELAPRPADEVVFESGDILAVRIAAPWDGAAVVRR